MKKKDIFIYLVFFLTLIVISCFSMTELDGIWGYGFSYNIASGLVPYRDFNMVVGPFYSIVLSLFIKLFGNYFLFFVIENSLIYSIIFLFIYKKIGNKSFLLLLLLGCCLTTFGYNTFCSMLVISILLLEDSKLKYKNIMIGILIGIIIMTKHNIGLCLALVYFFTSKNKIYAILSLIIPILPILVYLILNDALYAYIDFCFFGMGNFLNNFYPDIFSIGCVCFIFYILIKDYRKYRNKKVIYLFAFQIILFPIIDQGHVLPALLPVLYYVYSMDKQFDKKIKFYLEYFVCIGFVCSVIISPVFTTTLSLEDNFLFLQSLKKENIQYLQEYSNYIDKLVDKKVYLFLDNAYLIKIYRNENPSFYDLINTGNLGSDEQRYINLVEEECENKQCVFILDAGYFKTKLIGVQRSDLFKNYVLENATYLETLPSEDRVYINYQ